MAWGLWSPAKTDLFPLGVPLLLLRHIRTHSRPPSRGSLMTVRSTTCRLQSSNLCRERGHRRETLLGTPCPPQTPPPPRAQTGVTGSPGLSPGQEGPTEGLGPAAQGLSGRGLPAGSGWGPAPFACFPPAFWLISHNALQLTRSPAKLHSTPLSTPASLGTSCPSRRSGL